MLIEEVEVTPPVTAEHGDPFGALGQQIARASDQFIIRGILFHYGAFPDTPRFIYHANLSTVHNMKTATMKASQR